MTNVELRTLIKAALLEELEKTLSNTQDEGYDPCSNAGPNPVAENPYPQWNAKMRQLEEEEEEIL